MTAPTITTPGPRDPGLTRADAVATLLDLAHGLSPDQAGAQALLERVASRDHAVELRAYLVELGAVALLGGADPPHGHGSYQAAGRAGPRCRSLPAGQGLPKGARA